MIICHLATMTFYFYVLSFPVFTTKPISLQAFNNTSAFHSIVLISSPIKFISSA